MGEQVLIAGLEQGWPLSAQPLRVLGGQRTERPLMRGLRIQVRPQPTGQSPVRALQGLQQQPLAGTVHRAGRLPQRGPLRLPCSERLPHLLPEPQTFFLLGALNRRNQTKSIFLPHVPGL
ncbi:uncharacterized protein STAUR_8181 [Stigmatella aurantiaca DW4/3-1]|uniref:Uncharacterized protein n=1 Tax=Stigmatella aurantiaca (strain DW4/3-1) TaxID=378806 RepID=E3FUQ3_STIAD|nr:uncharacterized protein STAUR_8181 [Stigmatella aurantiaca DW4/3-1]